jgi:hypothetical protein
VACFPDTHPADKFRVTASSGLRTGKFSGQIHAEIAGSYARYLIKDASQIRTTHRVNKPSNLTLTHMVGNGTREGVAGEVAESVERNV